MSNILKFSMPRNSTASMMNGNAIGSVIDQNWRHFEARATSPASKWRQFWSITLPMALPFIMLAVLFRGIENFKMFDMVNLLTGGGPGSTTEVASITLKRAAFESWRTGYSSAFAIILFVTVFGLANIYVKALNRVKSR